MLRETRRQKSIPEGQVPEICVLDPDGDILGYLLRNKQAECDRVWACYHTSLYRFKLGGVDCGIIGCAVGGPFAVLLAEQLFVSGCRLLVSITSAGQIVPVRPPPYFVLIERALRDEGTSHHYLEPGKDVWINPKLIEAFAPVLRDFNPAIELGASWTTDAPYRETTSAIEAAKRDGVLAVEMESASLYAFAEARRKALVCFAHITNRMGAIEGDFEKGESNGSSASLRLIEAIVGCWKSQSLSGERQNA